jgi:hypothetical protein
VKFFFGFALFIWLLCGFVGAWRLEGLHRMQFKTIAKGPISLVHAMNEYPVETPGPSTS